MDVSFIFPHQLYEANPAIAKGRTIYLIEDELFFTQYPFHKHKLMLHRASMKAYQQHLESSGFTVTYIEAHAQLSLDHLFQKLKEERVTQLHVVDPTDYLLSRRLNRFADRYEIKLVNYESPNFLCDTNYLNDYFKTKKRYFLTEFYIEQRKRFDILYENGKPVGDKWTFDQENRKKLPESVVPPEPLDFKRNAFVAEAAHYVQTYFASNPGDVASFNYPVTFSDARKNLHDFVRNRLKLYGIYQDAISTHQAFLFHSVLTPALNIGLLQPQEVLEGVLAKDVSAPLNSVEGFVRQVLGWREFIRAVYLREGVFQRTNNHWQHTRPLPESFWNATTGIAPIDNVIQKSITHAYSNHIERLMIIGNFMLLCEIHPDEIYKWFMSLFIDAYDWVMVPNVYGMSQYADGGLMSTKPYISGSNYLHKMSHFKKGEWSEIWDALYWSFIGNHQEEFEKNPRMSMMVRQLQKMDKSKWKQLQDVRTKFLRSQQAQALAHES